MFDVYVDMNWNRPYHPSIKIFLFSEHHRRRNVSREQRSDTRDCLVELREQHLHGSAGYGLAISHVILTDTEMENLLSNLQHIFDSTDVLTVLPHQNDLCCQIVLKQLQLSLKIY